MAEDRPLSYFACSLSSSFIFFLISPNIIVIWPDHDDVCSQNFSCRVVTTSHYPVKSFLKSKRVTFIQAVRLELQDPSDPNVLISGALITVWGWKCKCGSISAKALTWTFHLATLSFETWSRFTGLAPAFRNVSALSQPSSPLSGASGEAIAITPHDLMKFHLLLPPLARRRLYSTHFPTTLPTSLPVANLPSAKRRPGRRAQGNTHPPSLSLTCAERLKGPLSWKSNSINSRK